MSQFFFIWVAIGFVGAAVVGLIIDRLKQKNQVVLPTLKEGERLPVVRDGELNVTVVRAGDSVVMVDENKQKIDVNKILN